MTSLVAWIGVDTHGPGSVYFSSDSRISWSADRTWDSGRKLFASKKYPHILGYCGDVTLPVQTLSQITELIDEGLLLRTDDDPEVCVEKVLSVLLEAVKSYPEGAKQPFDVIYGFRSAEKT